MPIRCSLFFLPKFLLLFFFFTFRMNKLLTRFKLTSYISMKRKKYYGMIKDDHNYLFQYSKKNLLTHYHHYHIICLKSSFAMACLVNFSENCVRHLTSNVFLLTLKTVTLCYILKPWLASYEDNCNRIIYDLPCH